MNHSVVLEQAISQALATKTSTPEVLISAERSGSPEIGGLELAVTQFDQGQIDLKPDHYRITSVRPGAGCVRISDAESEVRAHDHFGVPASLGCRLTTLGEDTSVFLDAMILPIVSCRASRLI